MGLVAVAVAVFRPQESIFKSWYLDLEVALL